MLYNGLPEARAILSQEVDNVEGAGVRRHALDYLKGRKVERMGMWTYDIMQPDEEELDELEQLAVSQMVMDRSAVATEEEPKLVQITPAESNYGEVSGRTQCLKPNLSNTPKGLDDEPTPPRC